MANTSATWMTVDGTRLDTLAYNIETVSGRISVPAVRGSNPQVPGRHGSIFVPNKTYDDGSIVLSMWVAGCDVDGGVPLSTEMALFRQNIETLTRLFGKRHALLDVQQNWPSGIRQCYAEVLQAYDLSARAISPVGKFNVLLNVPGVFWQDVSTSDYASATNLSPAVNLTMATYAGATAPMEDHIVVVRGPATNPRVTDVASGMWVQLNGTIASGTDWQIDCGNWTSRSGSAILFTAGGGSNRIVDTVYGGGGPRFLALTAAAGGPVVRLDGSAFGTNTQVQARGRRKFLA
jgi:hypothetical protein